VGGTIVAVAFPHSLVPMQPTLVRQPFHRAGWIWEEKYDGWRMLAFKDGQRVRLVSRQQVFLGLPHTFAGILVGQHLGRRLLFRGTVEWGLGMRTAQELLRRGRERTTSPFHDLRLSRGVTWLEPTLLVELTYSEIMEGRLRDPVCRVVV